MTISGVLPGGTEGSSSATCGCSLWNRRLRRSFSNRGIANGDYLVERSQPFIEHAIKNVCQQIDSRCTDSALVRGTCMGAVFLSSAAHHRCVQSERLRILSRAKWRSAFGISAAVFVKTRRRVRTIVAVSPRMHSHGPTCYRFAVECVWPERSRIAVRGLPRFAPVSTIATFRLFVVGAQFKGSSVAD